MTPAFQVLLCLCMLGLSYAAPKPRDIRWCVTSDVEIKKCNDLANSCSVNEIALLCVQKSSTEDCMKAISDGEADAISLDNGDVYKASLNPFNLRPIMTESYNSHRVHQGPCHKERQALLGAGRPLLGAFVPECDEKGNYAPKQCHGSTGYCWCVNKEGKEIEGTKTSPGQPSPTCEDAADQKSTPCLRHRQKALGGGKRPMIGAFVPKCDDDGEYIPKQCHGSTGHCWCVKKDGKEIEGSRAGPGKGPVICEEEANITPCLKERQKLLGEKTPAIGAFVPQCDEKGNYSPQQCHGSTGYCWCVNVNGEEIPGTKTPPGQPAQNCEAHAIVTPCLKERQKLLGEKTPAIGKFVPQCDEKGNYSPQQCHGSTGYCWCVNVNGEEIPGTKTPPGQPAQNCEAHEADKPCLKERQKILSEKTPSIGRFVPQCDEKGNFSPQQCHGSTGYCWCVNVNGEEIPGTKTPPGQPAQNCEAHEADKPCLKERQKLLSEKTPSIGRFVPQCDEKGNFSPQQCHGSTGYCWCVNVNGEEIPWTKTPPGQPAQNCEAHEADKPCLKERQKLLSEKTPSIGRFVPQCDEKGNFSPQQCHGSTGYCWCVNVNGEEIPWTKTPPGQPAQNCEAHEADKPCLKERQKILSEKTPSIGRFVPQCDEKGNFSPQQCHGSTGYCWCVNVNGEEIPGTKTPPGQPAQNCEAHDAVTCHYALAVVKKSSTFQFDQLKGKRSCHSGVGESAGWIVPMAALLRKNLLLWKGPEEKSFEKAVSEFFSASCAPGAKEENLCKQCAGQEDKCKRSPGELYYGDEGAFRCLRDDKGDVAFLEHTALSEQNSEDFELICPDYTRRPLSQHKDCNFGKVPAHAVVTRSNGDKTKDITEYLLEAQKKQCKLFSSTHGQDLLFEDTTTSLITLPAEMDTFLFLGPEVFNAMHTLHGAPLPSSKEIRWCTQSKNEKLKCDNWSSVSGGAIKCLEPSSVHECIIKILKGEAEAITVSVDYMYTALQCGLVIAVEEYHNKNDFTPCQTLGAKYTDFGTPSVVALVKKSDKDITWNNLKGKKSCHTGVGHQAGWIIPTSLISKETKNCDIGTYFSESCAPGSAIDSNLCKLCIGDPQNTKANTKCSPNDKEAYYGNEGAVRCLAEKGDVAFVPHTAIFENTDGKNPALWAKDLKSTDFELLCLDGSRAPVSDYRKCDILRVPPRAVITRPETLSDVVRHTINQQSLYGRKGFQKDIFQMFSSSNGQNLLFNDGTQCLIEFDRQIEKGILDDYFGKRYHSAVYKDSHCLPISELASACAFHHC